MIIEFEHIKLYVLVCTLVAVCIYTILTIYVIQHKGNRKTLSESIPMFISFYITLIFAGIFIVFGLATAFSIVFLDVKVTGSTEGFAILFGLLFAYFPISIVLGQLKSITYNVLMSCIQKYN